MLYDIRTFGTSHGPEVGLTASGLPKGENFSLSELQSFLERRRPGKENSAKDGTSQREETDEPVFVSGVTRQSDDTYVLNGEPFEVIIKNRDCRSSDYDDLYMKPRPGHADYTSYIKYGTWDSGGGRFSGRLTAPLCVLGGICRQILERNGITVTAEIVRTGDIEAAIRSGDSVGGIVRCTVTGLPAGVGGPFTEGLESRLSAAVFAVPAVKGVAFGAGFAAADMKGSENNDPFACENGRVITLTNHCGGILGGISTGMPVVFQAAFKPAPSISLPQKTVDLETDRETVITIKGRHDTCVVKRALPVVEAVTSMTILEILQEEKKLWKKA